jgi:hypothetical protein
MAAPALYRGIKASVDLTLYELLPNGSQLIYQVPPPSAPKLNTGITEVLQEARSKIGTKIIVNTFANEEKPEIDLDFPALIPNVFGLLLGKKFVTGTGEVARYTSTTRLVDSTVIPVVGSSLFDGFGVALDEPDSYAAVLRNGLSVPLTRLAATGYNPATAATDTFAVGASGLVSFSANLLGSYVTYNIKQTISGTVVKLSETPLTGLGMVLNLMDVDNALVQITSSSVAPVQQGVNIDFSAPSTAVKLRIQNDGSRCATYNVAYLQVARAC